MIIPTEKLHPDAAIPFQATADSAGSDLCAIEECYILPGACRLVKTGLKMAIPQGCAGMVCSRSGLALKKQVFVLNAPGIVDSDYRGDVGVILYNAGTDPFDINVGDRVAQLLIVKVEPVYYESVVGIDDTERGAGGFGSTGVKQ